jgi:hypothetical protein
MELAVSSPVNGTAHQQPDKIWYFVGATILILAAYLIWGKKRIPNPCLRWLTPFILIGFLWIAYGISGISISGELYYWLAIIVSIWVALLLIALILAATRLDTTGKLTRPIGFLAKKGEFLTFPLSLVTLLASILFGWVRLWNAGAGEWWMEPILFVGFLIFVAVSIIYPLTSMGKRD